MKKILTNRRGKSFVNKILAEAYKPKRKTQVIDVWFNEAQNFSEELWRKLK